MNSDHPFHYFVGDAKPELGSEVVAICGKKLRVREYLTLTAIWGGGGTCPGCFKKPVEGDKKGNVQFVIDERMTRSGNERRSGLDRRIDKI